MSVIVFGSINTDIGLGVGVLPKPGETVLTEGYQVASGGKGCNQAVAAAKLGADVRMVGAVGDDAWASVPMGAMEAGGCGHARRVHQRCTYGPSGGNRGG
ncbi:MAG: PfkB family carbohydrate kinase [Alphaproteobacteria bacterium]